MLRSGLTNVHFIRQGKHPCSSRFMHKFGLCIIAGCGDHEGNRGREGSAVRNGVAGRAMRIESAVWRIVR
jgi:hypothetical protein